MSLFDPINRAALAQYPGLLHDWLPAGRVKGREFICGDLRGSPGRSVSINIDTGKWGEFAGEDRGGDPVSLYAALNNLPQGKAAAELANRLGVHQSNGHAEPKPRPANPWQPMLPPPQDAPAPDLGGFDHVYTYRDQSGVPLFYIRRKDARGDQRKVFTPLTYGTLNGKTGWHSKHPLVPRPLYGLEKLSRAGLVIVCEGEKAADAAQKLFPQHIAISWAGGAQNVKSADWSPLGGREVLIWPDNDAPGKQAANAVKTHLDRISESVTLLRVDDTPEESDAADLDVADQAAWLADHLPKPNAPETFPLVWFDDIEPSLDIRDFVEGVLVEQSGAVVYGESNAGKTFWTTDLALHVAAGKQWCGRDVEQGGVIYCVLEGGNGFRNRVSAWRTEHYMDGAELPFASIQSSINLLDPAADTPKLIETIKAASQRMGMPVKLVVIDTLSRAMAGGNENSPEDMGALVLNMDAIRQATGASVLFVHHSGKDAAKGARGHSLLRAAIDTEIEVVASEDSEEKTATAVKQRELSKGDVFGFKLKVVTLGKNRRGKDVTTCVVEPVEDAKPIPKKGRKHSQNATLGLRALENALGSSGAFLPALPEYPEKQWATTQGAWRGEFYQLHGDDKDAARLAFNRAKASLLADESITQRNEFVWRSR